MLLSNKSIIVTGGYNGIGYGCVKAYIEEVARVAVPHIQSSDNLIGKIGNNHLGLLCDITNEDQEVTVIITTIDHFGKIDAIHNNAGKAGSARLLSDVAGKHETWADMEDIFHTQRRKSIYLIYN